MTARPADNPFASHRIDALDYRFADGGGLVDVTTALARHGRRGAIVGPHGSGKTTLLDTLAESLEGEVVRARLSADTTRPLARALHQLPSRVGPGHSVLLDGAEQLGTWAWRRFRQASAAAGTLVVTSHRQGRLATIHECRTTLTLLVELVLELDPVTADAVDLGALFRRHQGNLRLCFRELYDLHAGW